MNNRDTWKNIVVGAATKYVADPSPDRKSDLNVAVYMLADYDRENPVAEPVEP